MCIELLHNLIKNTHYIYVSVTKYDFSILLRCTVYKSLVSFGQAKTNRIISLLQLYLKALQMVQLRSSTVYFSFLYTKMCLLAFCPYVA